MTQLNLKLGELPISRYPKYFKSWKSGNGKVECSCCSRTARFFTAITELFPACYCQYCKEYIEKIRGKKFVII